MSYRPDFPAYRADAGSPAPAYSDFQARHLHETPETDLRALFASIMADGVHGFCFSLYEDGQKPGDIISEAQIRRRLEILRPHCTWIRSFSTTEGNEHIPRIAKELGMKTLVGAWLGKEDDKNREEIEGLVALAQAGLVDVAAVGNEVLYRRDLTEDALLALITEVKERIPGVPVGYVDAYYEFTHRPRLAEVSDVILCNCYPFWERTAYEDAFAHMRHMFALATEAGKGKPVLITETGWPSEGEPLGGAVPSWRNALSYFINAQLWSKADGIPMFYFSSFDESWKVGAEGTVGAYWGVWDKHERLKY